MVVNLVRGVWAMGIGYGVWGVGPCKCEGHSRNFPDGEETPAGSSGLQLYCQPNNYNGLSHLAQ